MPFDHLSALRKYGKPAGVLGGITLLFILFTVLGLDKQVAEVPAWIASLGVWGPVAFVVLYLGAVIIALPATPLGIAAGALFGSVEGVALVSLSSTIGAGLTFLLARYLARDSVTTWLASHEKYRRLDDLTQRHGMLMVAVARLIPFFPFNIINYAFGLTAVSFRTYLFWSWLCMLPGTILFVVGADAISTWVVTGQVPWLLLGVVAVSVVLVVVLAKAANTFALEKTPREVHEPTDEARQDLARCTCCGRCLDACPVYDRSFPAATLNAAIAAGTGPAPIRRFAYQCLQCGRCVPVCPEGLSRERLLRVLRGSLRRPYSYRRYLLIRGPKMGFARVLQQGFVAFRRRRDPDLAAAMERTPQGMSEVLFYPGCYVYSPTAIRVTEALLRRIGTPYAILGGVSYCCGAPHLLQGRFGEAQACQTHLASAIAAADPTIILTSCLECLEALEDVKTQTSGSYEVLHVAEYLERHRAAFTIRPLPTPVVLHRSCRLSRHPSVDRAVTTLLSSIAPSFTTMDECCTHWSHGEGPRAPSPQDATLVSACLTCAETLPTRPPHRCYDIVELFAKAALPKEDGR